MTFNDSLRRTALGLAATTMLVGGSLGFVAAATTAGAADGVSAPVSVNTIALHNNTAEADTDCPVGGAAYWHFVFAPNDDSASFTSITLNLKTGESTSESLTFSGAAIVPNGTQTDNVFVAVPAGHTLTDLLLTGSSAAYTGVAPNLFNLSHTCSGTVGTTTTTAPEGTTTTTAPEETTTTTAPEETTTTVEVLGTVQTTAAPTTVAEVMGAVQVNGELPYTGTNTSGMVAAGLAVLLGGALLVGLARTKGRHLGEQ